MASPLPGRVQLMQGKQKKSRYKKVVYRGTFHVHIGLELSARARAHPKRTGVVKPTSTTLPAVLTRGPPVSSGEPNVERFLRLFTLEWRVSRVSVEFSKRKEGGRCRTPQPPRFEWNDTKVGGGGTRRDSDNTGFYVLPGPTLSVLPQGAFVVEVSCCRGNEFYRDSSLPPPAS